MNFKVGDRVVLRNGMRGMVTYISEHKDITYPIQITVPDLKDPDIGQDQIYSLSGKYWHDTRGDSPYDIVAVLGQDSQGQNNVELVYKVAILESEILNLKSQLERVTRERDAHLALIDNMMKSY